MATDREPFEKLDESLKPAIDRIRTAAHKVQAPPDLLAKSMERIRQLPLPPTRKRPTARGLLTKSVETIRQFRWLSWVTPLAPVFAVLLVMVPIKVQLTQVEGRLEALRLENRTKGLIFDKEGEYATVRHNPDINNVVLCNIDISGSKAITITMPDDFQVIIKSDIYVDEKLCSNEAVGVDTVIYLPTRVYDGGEIKGYLARGRRET